MGGRHTALHCAMDCARLDCARSNFAMTLWTASVTGLGSVTHVETAGAASSIVIVQRLHMKLRVLKSARVHRRQRQSQRSEWNV